MATSTAENYLKVILVQSRIEDEVVSTGAISEALGVTPGTVTAMMKSLASQGLLEHRSHEGVRLTPEGRRVALNVVRKHRLVETFLVQILKMDWAEVDREADTLEHAISDRVLARIDDLLEHPKVDPHGDLIPRGDSQQLEHGDVLSLSNCEEGKPFRVERILDQSPEFLAFVQSNGLKPGAEISVRRHNRVSGVVECELTVGVCTLGMPEAGKIQVRQAR